MCQKDGEFEKTLVSLRFSMYMHGKSSTNHSLFDSSFVNAVEMSSAIAQELDHRPYLHVVRPIILPEKLHRRYGQR